ncbi:MAG TPA: beta-propeller fold lactonase family protein [Solirubrobacteraceae bacterium]|jgi:DNA-binding beta-propeller fold protein YncE
MLTVRTIFGVFALRAGRLAMLPVLALLLIALLLFAAAIPAASHAAPPLGALSQLASPFNCVSEEGYEEEVKAFIGCGTLLPKGSMSSTYEAPVSPDGKNVYSVAIAGALIEYSRQSDGSLKPIGCITEGTEPCASENVTTEATAMKAPAAIAISPGGGNVYVVTQGSNDLVTFTRDTTTGLLTETGCISAEAASPCAIKEAKGLGNPYGVTISSDGKNVYVASLGSEAIAEFSRNTEGALAAIVGHECIGGTGSGCPINTAIGLHEVVTTEVSPDGSDLYAAAGAKDPESDVAAFAREPGTGVLKQLAGAEGCIGTVASCAEAKVIEGSESLVISPDGKNVYANSFDDSAIVELKRNSTTGALAQLPEPNGCLAHAKTGPTAGCSPANGVGNPLGVAISPGGEDVYASSSNEDDVAEFTRNAETGALTAFPAPYECIGKTGKNTCGTSGATGIAGARRVTVSPDGRNLYVAGQPDHAVVELARAGEPPVESTCACAPPIGNQTVVKQAPPVVVPPPIFLRTGNVAPVSGRVLVKVPGSKQFVPLQTLRQIPFGSVIDATNGKVSVTTALPNGKTQTGQFFAGEFILRQERNGMVIAELTGGNFSVCPTKRERLHVARVNSASAYAAASGKHVVRKLWANAHGKFSTKGNYAAGAVQGTEWLTEDLCDGTLIRVTRDKVAVTNLVNHKHVEVKTGHKYLAKAP